MTSTTILTFTGKTVDLANPKVEDIDIADIAHALAGLNRYTGHTQRYMSVAEHSLLVSGFCSNPYRLEGLMHDAQEAYLGDMSSPLKSMFPEYKALERRWEQAIAAKFCLKAMPAEIKRYDLMALEAEKSVLAVRILRHEADIYGDGDAPELPDMRTLVEQGGDYWVSYEEQFLHAFNALMTERYLEFLDCGKA